MQRVNEFSFFELATFVHPLTELEASEHKYADIWYRLFQARDALDTLFTLRTLNVCMAAATDLSLAINAIVPRDFDKAIEQMSAAVGNPSAETIAPYLTYKVSEAAKKFETVLAAEVQVSDTYFVSKKGAYSTADLIDRAHIAFPEALRATLPSDAKADFDQAGKCLAFDLGTATGFHLIRSTEAVIRAYYQEVTGALPKLKSRNWGSYCKWLAKAGANPKIIKHLEDLKDDYRNPVLHPEDTLSPSQALVMFGLCTAVIVQMLEEVKRLKATTEAKASGLAVVGTQARG